MEPTQAEGLEALRYLAKNLDKFKNLWAVIQNLQHRAAVGAASLREEGRFEEAEAAKEVVREIGILRNQWAAIADELEPILGWIPGTGGFLGAVPLIPVAIIVAAISLFGSVAAIFGKVSVAERVVTLVEQGRVTPEQAALIPLGETPGSGIADAIKWAVIGMAAYTVLQHAGPEIKRRLRK